MVNQILTQKEIAERLNLSFNTINIVLSRSEFEKYRYCKNNDYRCSFIINDKFKEELIGWMEMKCKSNRCPARTKEKYKELINKKLDSLFF